MKEKTKKKKKPIKPAINYKKQEQLRQKKGIINSYIEKFIKDNQLLGGDAK